MDGEENQVLLTCRYVVFYFQQLIRLRERREGTRIGSQRREFGLRIDPGGL